MAFGQVVAVVNSPANQVLVVGSPGPTGASGPPNVIENVNTVAVSGAGQTIPAPLTASLSDITLTANCTFTFPTLTKGSNFLLVLRQDSTGNRTVTWPATVKWSSGVTPTLSTPVTKADVFSFFTPDGTSWFGLLSGLNI